MRRYHFSAFDKILLNVVCSGSQDARAEISLATEEGSLLPFTSGFISNTSGSAMVNADAAIALIHRYCSLLPQDQYCSLVPQFVWWYVHTEGVVELTEVPI